MMKCWMHRSSLILILLIGLPSVSLASDFSGRVVVILDGDTIEVLHHRTTERVRLVGIDCPEKKQPFGQRAKQATSTLSFGQHVTVHRAGKDRYGRTLGTVELTDGTNVNYELVRQGWCWWYWKYAPDEIFLAILEMQAREAKKGLWADPSPVPPWEWRKRGKRSAATPQ
jgi:endonuclease YncB( thermonuclease family)